MTEEWKPAIGDVVRVKGIPGPSMVVDGLSEQAGLGIVRCIYFLLDGHLVWQEFRADLLQLVSREEPAEEALHPIAASLDNAASRKEQELAVSLKEQAEADRFRYAHSEGV